MVWHECSLPNLFIYSFFSFLTTKHLVLSFSIIKLNHSIDDDDKIIQMIKQELHQTSSCSTRLLDAVLAYLNQLMLGISQKGLGDLRPDFGLMCNF